ncbi:PASTA domain-containing protein [Gemmatimonas sp.]|uniref:PASTA domain-containing protein n=1 Tax=Gemmatimonas sp. TaxID=1962908 RepID=UPI00333E4C32
MATAKSAPKPAKKKSPAGRANTRLWLKRAVVALIAGVSIGAGAGVATVSRLEPGRGTGVDSLAVMLDSIAKGRIPEPSAAERTAERQRVADSVKNAAPVEVADELIAIPSLADLEEGAARNALIDAGLQVGEVQFQPSPKPAGTVLSTIPAAGAKVAPETPVTLVLSDGRTGTDTLSRPSPTHAP